MAFEKNSKELIEEAIRNNYAGFSILSAGSASIDEIGVDNYSGCTILKFRISINKNSIGREIHFHKHQNGTPYYKAHFDYMVDTNGMSVQFRNSVFGQFENLIETIKTEWLNIYKLHFAT